LTTPSAAANATLTVDLAKQEIRGPDGGIVTVRDRRRTASIACSDGLDDIGLTMVKSDQIERFEGQVQGGAALV